eukprot:bmy_08259T0
MEMKEIAKYKTLWKMNSTTEPLFVTGIDVNPMKKFTIPKIRRTAGKVGVQHKSLQVNKGSLYHIGFPNVLFGKVKKIQPSVDKNKVSLDPSPNFDCHMSRSIPSLKDTIELQAYSSAIVSVSADIGSLSRKKYAVYLYEYDDLSKPVDKPRQCLPYAIVTYKEREKKQERTWSLKNCTVAKRIGKGKDATVTFERFGKPIDPFVQENCSCSALNSEINPYNSNISNSYGNVQNETISVLEAYRGQMEHNSAECRDTSQVHAYDSGLSFIPSDTRESVNNGDLLNLTHLKDVLSGLAAAFPLHNNIGSSTVITSKLIKDPRLMKREESMGKHNTITGLNEILPFEKSLDFANSEINLSSMPTSPASSSEVMPGDQTVLTNYLDAPCFKISLNDSQTQAHNMGSKTYDCTAPNKITMAEQYWSPNAYTFSTPKQRKHT